MYCQITAALVLTILVSVAITAGHIITNEVQCEQELVFAMLVNRHGDRAPDDVELSLSDQQDAIRNRTFFEGLEGLTLNGKRKGYQLGKFIRKRYGDLKLMSNYYVANEIAIRTTEKDRTKMTVQVAMAAAYPPEPEQEWDAGLGKVWQPIPYTSVPLSEDYLRYYSNCKRYLALMEEEAQAAVQEEFRPYDDLIPLLKEKTGRNFTEDPLLWQAFEDLLKSTLSLGLEIPEWTKPLLGRLSEAARLTYLLYFRNHEMTRIGGGVLLNQFIEAAEQIILGLPVSQKLRIFSAHDFNVGALMMVSNVKSDFSIPAYGSLFALELYKSKNGEYSVVPIYLATAGSSAPQRLQIKGCESDDGSCDFLKFQLITKEFRLTERDYYRICGIRTEL